LHSGVGLAQTLLTLPQHESSYFTQKYEPCMASEAVLRILRLPLIQEPSPALFAMIG
jgi:hypothetical protein